VRKASKAKSLLMKTAQGTVLSFVALAVIAFCNRNIILGDIFLFGTIPMYRLGAIKAELVPVIPSDVYAADDPPGSDSLVGINDIIFPAVKRVNETPTTTDIPQTPFQTPTLQNGADTYQEAEFLEKLRDFDYLRTQFFVEEKGTALAYGDVAIDEWLAADLTVDKLADGPKVLIFHTHSTEMFYDSDPRDPMEGVMGLGSELARILAENYGIETIHHIGRYDITDGNMQILGAYERMEPNIEKVLRDFPSIQLAIDIHRDGVSEPMLPFPFVTEIDGRRTAQIMFVNGLCQVVKNGQITPVYDLPNVNLQTNLALSFRMQLYANAHYPGFARKIYLKPYRYSLHMLPKSILVEVGAQNNTKEEARNALIPLAEIIVRTVQ